MSSWSVPEATRQVFAALADPTRIRLLNLLGESASSASRLSVPLGISRQAVAKHLRILLEAGLVKRNRTGRETVFETVVEGLAPVSQFINQLRGDRRA
ncbi:ArsR/SmtB family transcription factor [Paeniglutamicibacter terrestris]|uniref:Winged helix-turn-helix transcriptional regulator n=1 Tax=Paeniglutamicibacter terrestris TaxID=2723403 RepID=A0ABX1G8C3_9MICC|nr:metalloregulator ArsR/SmtB family transcription factor [Paeniglutamicibacter terrestris]NKG22510.1 winged helix-turn-helix transcriptional regulator [Paeniglutamicibacter terrestris]